MNTIRSPSALQLLAILATAACGTACSSPGQYVWADSYVSGGDEHPKPYSIAPGDLIQVRIYNQDHLSTRARVRNDGKVSLPLLNDVPAAGMTPVDLANDLQVRLKDYIKAPSVTVSIEETRPATVYVAGEVTRPGIYPLESSPGVLQALINAGGLTTNASADRIFVLRQGPKATRIRFTYDALTRLEGTAASFALRCGDVVVVE
jgi:polysaccharide export outer membrane protein